MYFLSSLPPDASQVIDRYYPLEGQLRGGATVFHIFRWVQLLKTREGSSYWKLWVSNYGLSYWKTLQMNSQTMPEILFNLAYWLWLHCAPLPSISIPMSSPSSGCPGYVAWRFWATPRRRGWHWSHSLARWARWGNDGGAHKLMSWMDWTADVSMEFQMDL